MYIEAEYLTLTVIYSIGIKNIRDIRFYNCENMESFNLVLFKD
jgi:hypothetical protein